MPRREMRKSASVSLLAVALLFLAAASSQAWHGRVFVGVGPVWWGPPPYWYYPPPYWYYPPTYYTYPPVVVQQSPPVYPVIT
jgi:hypothetical protein